MKTKKVTLPESKSRRPGQSHPSKNYEINAAIPPVTVEQPASAPSGRCELPAKYTAILRPGYPLTKSKRAQLANLLHVITSTPETSPEFLRCLTELAKSGMYLALAGNMDLFAQKVLDWPTGKIEPILQKCAPVGSTDAVAVQAVPKADHARISTTKEKRESDDLKAGSVCADQVTPSATPDESSAHYWVNRINQKAAQSVDSIIATGRELIAAKERLSHGQWKVMFESGWVRLHLRSAEKLMRIARNSVLSKTTNCSLLPVSQDALYLLSGVDEEKLESGLRDGCIGPHMTIGQAKEFAKQGQPANPSPIGDFDYYYEKIDNYLTQTFATVPEEFFVKMTGEARAILQKILDDHRTAKSASKTGQSSQ